MEHTVRAFGEELQTLTAEVARLGGLAEAQVSDAIQAVARRDADLAEAVIERDKRLDNLQADIERKALRLIALRQPVAQDLRHTVLTQSEPLIPLTRSIERMGVLVAGRLRDVLDSYTSSQVEGAVSVWNRDDEIDEHYNSLFRELLTYMMGDPRTINPCAHLLFIAKNLERVGDYATNIAEMIHFEITGEELSIDRPKGEPITA
jgi:phosphate transport system protein